MQAGELSSRYVATKRLLKHLTCTAFCGTIDGERSRSMHRKATSIRMSEQAKILLEKLAQHFAISQTAVLELAIRKLAKQEGVILE